MVFRPRLVRDKGETQVKPEMTQVRVRTCSNLAKYEHLIFF